MIDEDLAQIEPPIRLETVEEQRFNQSHGQGGLFAASSSSGHSVPGSPLQGVHDAEHDKLAKQSGRDAAYAASLKKHIRETHGVKDPAWDKEHLKEWEKLHGKLHPAAPLRMVRRADYEMREGPADEDRDESGKWTDGGGSGGGGSDAPSHGHDGVDSNSPASLANHLGKSHGPDTPGSVAKHISEDYNKFTAKHGYTGMDKTSPEAMIHYGLSKGIDKLRELHDKAHGKK